jgi:hypothetical protein
MMDPLHARLLTDCEDYLERQQELLERLAALGTAPDVLAGMDSALDQLSHAVTVQWREFAPELVPGRGPRAYGPDGPAAPDG